MPTLSKQVIENIANKMTEKSKKNVEQLLVELKALVTEIYEDQIPAEVMKAFKARPEYIKTSSAVYLDGHGFNRESLSMNKQLPSVSDWHNPMKLSAKISDRIMVAKRKWEKAKKEHEELRRETESALLALKTHKNIRENLPEAAPYLPAPMSNSLVVNFTGLQKKLNNQPGAEKAAVKN